MFQSYVVWELLCSWYIWVLVWLSHFVSILLAGRTSKMLTLLYEMLAAVPFRTHVTRALVGKNSHVQGPHVMAHGTTV